MNNENYISLSKIDTYEFLRRCEMETYELFKSIVYDYRADILLPAYSGCRNKRFMMISFKRSAVEELLLFVKQHDPFDPIGSIELFIDEMEEAASEYPKSSLMFQVFKYTATDILDILKSSV